MKHPTWGPKKLLEILTPHYSSVPAISTAADILKRKGLIPRQQKKTSEKASRMPQERSKGTERHLECRLQGSLQDEERALLLSVDRL